MFQAVVFFVRVDMLETKMAQRAAANGHEGLIKLSFKNGAMLDYRDMFGWTPLSRVAANGRERMVKLLLEEGATLEARQRSPRIAGSMLEK